MDVATYLARLMRDPKFSSSYNSLIVAMDLDAVAPASSVTTFAPIFRAWSVRRAGVKWAFVLPSAASKDLVESALAQARLCSVQTKCFLTEGAACAWLEAGLGSAPQSPGAAVPATSQ